MSEAASAARSAWQAIYQISPIILQGGSFINAPTGLMPISLLAGSLLSTVQGLVTNSQPFFGEYMVIPGGTALAQEVATYPLANLQTAANATIQMPLTLSLLLRAPVRDGFGYATKAAIFSSMRLALETHNNAGGTYIVMTPALMYQNGLLLNITDVTDGENTQPQTMWQFDFFFPLITRAEAGSAFNKQLSRLAGGMPITGAPSWAALGV